MNPCLSNSPEQTRAHAAQAASQAKPGDMVLLYGELGAGKTEWVKGFVEALGCDEEVTSPTFTLLHEYRGGRLPVYHWDLYRLDEKTDWSVLSLDEGREGVVLVEWPEKFAGKWPVDVICVRIHIHSGDRREIICES